MCATTRARVFLAEGTPMRGVRAFLVVQKARTLAGASVRIIRHDRNRGQSTAIVSGVRAASVASLFVRSSSTG